MKLLLPLLLLFIAATSCQSGQQKSLSMIPGSAIAIFSLDIGRTLAGDMSIQDLMNWSERAEKNPDLALIARSGLDFSGKAYGYVASGGLLSVTSAFILPLSNAATFEQALATFAQDRGWAFYPETQDGLRVVALEENALVIWDSERAFVTQTTGLTLSRERLMEEAIDQFRDGAKDPLEEAGPAFEAMADSRHDAALLVDTRSVGSLIAFGMPGWKKAGLEDLQVFTGIDFFEGKAETETRFFYRGEKGAIGELAGSQADAGLLDNVVAGNPPGCFTLAINPQAWLSFLEDLRIVDKLDEKTEPTGLSGRDLLARGLDGEVAVVIQRPRRELLDGSLVDELSLTMSAGVKDRQVVGQMLSEAHEAGRLLWQGDYYVESDSSSFLRLEDDRLLVSNDRQVAVAWAGKQGDDLPADMTKWTREGPVTLWLELDKLVEAASREAVGRGEETRWAEQPFPFSRLQVAGEKPGSTSAGCRAIVYTRDPEEPALAAFLTLLMKPGRATNPAPAF